MALRMNILWVQLFRTDAFTQFLGILLSKAGIAVTKFYNDVTLQMGK